MVIDGEAAATHGRKDKAVVAMGMGQVDETATVTMGRKRPCTLGKVEQWHMLTALPHGKLSSFILLRLSILISPISSSSICQFLH